MSSLSNIIPHSSLSGWARLKSVFRYFIICTSMVVMMAASTQDEQKYPNVIDAQATKTAENTYRFDVSLSSPYDTPQRYADAFRVLNETGEIEYGVRTLWHDHANEQPFTRSLRDVNIPSDINRVMIQGRDKSHGYGGDTLIIALPK